ncbi:MAG: hypothetical protein EHM43_09795 [Ignavibacteriae bacterium]|nr:MAG: hypothetical protein EHM43_09795 [Ignavibacteriota bacterium]
MTDRRTISKAFAAYTRLALIAVLVTSSLVLVSCEAPEDSLMDARCERITVIQVDSGAYVEKMRQRKTSLYRLLDTATFDGLVIGNARSISDDVHFQELIVYLGKEELEDLLTAIEDYEKRPSRGSSERRRKRLSSSFSRDDAFNAFVISTYPKLYVSFVVPRDSGHQGHYRPDSPEVIDMIYGHNFPLHQLWLLDPAPGLTTRQLVWASFGRDDQCKAAIVFPL